MKDLKHEWKALLIAYVLVTGCCAAPTLRNMRIFCDYEKAELVYGSGHAYTPRYVFAKKLAETARKYFQIVLKVQSEQTLILEATQPSGRDFIIPSVNKDIDLYVYINAIIDANTTAFASALIIKRDLDTNRPISGVYFLNLWPLKVTGPNAFHYFSTFAHEFFHILGFSSSSLNMMKKGGVLIPENQVVLTGNYYGGTRKIIVLKEVLDFARIYYNNPIIVGIPFEDGGGSGSSGSHWEKAFFPTEFMSPSVELPDFLSEFSFKFLEGTGWYTVNYEYVQEYTWGKGNTNHFSGSCPTTRGEYCTIEDADECSHDFMSKATCNLYATFSSCLYLSNTGKMCTIMADDIMMPDATEKYGPSSRCIMWGKIPKCNQVSCINNKVTVKVPINGVVTDFFCGEDGSMVRVGYYGLSFRCPSNQTKFCALLEPSKRCPNDCNGRGMCVGLQATRKCVCMSGYGGNDCSAEGAENLPDGESPAASLSQTLFNASLLYFMTLLILL